MAFAASMGWLTVIHIDGSHYTREWHITAEGEFALRHHLEGK